MPKLINTSSWKELPSDIAYKDPFSETTTRIRKKLIFFSALGLLNSLYPIDISSSHLLGLKFQNNISPSISGIICLLVLYFSIELFVYSFQELKAWYSQAKALSINIYYEKLGEMYRNQGSYSTIINGALNAINQNKQAIESYTQNFDKYNHSSDQEAKITDYLNLLDLHGQSLKNHLENIEKPQKKYLKALDESMLEISTHLENYRSAMKWQEIKIGLIEILTPFVLAMIVISNSLSDIFALLIRSQ